MFACEKSLSEGKKIRWKKHDEHGEDYTFWFNVQISPLVVSLYLTNKEA